MGGHGSANIKMTARLGTEGCELNTPKAAKFDVRRIYKGGTKTLIFRVFGVSLLFGLHILLGNALGPAQYGLYSFALSVTGLLMSFAALGLPTALMRYVVQYKAQQKLNELKGALQQLPAFALLASFVFSALILIVAIPLLDGHEWGQGLRYSTFLLPVFVLEQIRRNLYKGYARPIGSIMPDEIIRPIALGACVWLLQIKAGSTAITLYLAITTVLAAGFLAWLYRDVGRPLSGHSAKYETKEWFATALPMAYGSIGYLMMNQTDVVMLGILKEMRLVGVYSAANRIAMLCQIILGTAAIIAIPMITAAYHGGRMHEFRNILGHTRIWIVTLTLPLFLVMIAFPQMILSMFGDDYVEGAWILRILATGQFVSAVAGPLGLALSMTDRQKILATVMLLAGVLKVFLNFVAIPVWGAIGAATVTMLCLLLINITLLMIIHRSISSVFTSK